MNLWSFLQDPASWVGPDGIGARIVEHLVYTGLSLLIATAVSVVLGVIVGHFRAGNLLVVGTSNAARAIPTLGLVVLVVTLLGTGITPVVLALTVLAIPPILNATSTGVREADPGAVHAARALGMTTWQVIWRVELPLATPLIVSGIRSATLQVVSTATVAALAASGGLGRLVVDGQRLGASGYPEMFAGAVLVAALAIVLDVALGSVVWGLRRRRSRIGRTAAELDSAPAAETTPA
ncbi:ABC transporter permease [Propionibacteriaceae bacterium Y2011]